MRCTVVTGVQTCSFPICRLGSPRRTAATVPADPARTREALKDQASSFEEGKADILGLYMIRQLADMGELDKTKLMDNYVTFLAGILRSVRFGAADAHAKANMVRFNFFAQEIGRAHV